MDANSDRAPGRGRRRSLPQRRRVRLRGLNSARLIAAIVCFVVPSAQAKPPVRVVSKDLHCSMEVPDGWKRKTDAPKSTWFYIGPMQFGFATNISVTLASDVSKTTAKRTKIANEKIFFEAVRKQFGKMGTVYDTQKTMLCGQPAYSYRATTNFSGRKDFEVHQIYCFYDGRDYVLTFTYPPSLKKKYDPIGDQIIASFRFEK